MADRTVLERMVIAAAELRERRDVHNWPEPRTVRDLRRCHRAMLTNDPRDEKENLVLAAALMLMVAEDVERAGGDPERAAVDAPEPRRNAAMVARGPS